MSTTNLIILTHHLLGTPWSGSSCLSGKFSKNHWFYCMKNAPIKTFRCICVLLLFSPTKSILLSNVPSIVMHIQPDYFFVRSKKHIFFSFDYFKEKDKFLPLLIFSSKFSPTISSPDSLLKILKTYFFLPALSD